MYDFFFKHYGLDWAAAVFMFLSMWRLGGHKRDGFVLAAVASGFWIAFNVKVDSAGGIIANAVILGMAMRSFWTFGRRSDAADPAGGTGP
jgi:hypothetical protein